MATRTLTLTDTLLTITATPRVGVPVAVYLLTPGALPVTDLEGGVLFNGQQFGETTSTDVTGHWVLTAVYPGDLRDGNGNALTTPCQLVVVEGGVQTLSPLSFAYAASITVSTWYPLAVSAAGMLPMLADLRLVSNAADQGATIQFGITATAVAPNGTTLDAAQNVPISTDAGGNAVLPNWPSAGLNPATTTYTITFPDGTIWYYLAPATPTGNQGAYNAGTTYHPNAGTKASPADVVLSGGIYYQCIAATTGNAPPNATFWQVWPGEPIVWHLTQITTPGGVVISTTGVSASPTLTALPDDPINPALTLDDDLVILAARLGLVLRTITASATAAETDDWLLVDATAGSITLTLPAASARVRPLRVIRKDGSANTVSIARAGSDTINGATSLALNTQYLWAVLKPDTVSAWYAQTGSGGGASPLTTEGDLYYHHAGVDARLAVGAAGTILASSGTDPVYTGAPTLSGEITASDFKPTGLTGATAASRYGGATTAGAPATGTWALGDWITDQAGKRWTCTTAGTPGTWTQEPGTGGPVATTTVPGIVLIDVPPGSGSPVALTTERLGAPSGVARLDGNRQESSLALPPLGAGSGVAEAGRWTRYGTTLSPSQTWEGNIVGEATVLYLEAYGGFVMFYTANNFSAPAMGRATSTDGKAWTKSTGPVLGQGAGGVAGYVSQISIVEDDGTLYCYYAEGPSTGAMAVATSTDGGITWSRQATVLAAGVVSWASSQWANSAVWKEGTRSWKMLAEANNGTIWQIGLITATNPLGPWTASSSTLTTLQVAAGGAYGGPWVPYPVQKRNGSYHLWLHAAPGTGNLPTDIYHYTSPDLATWTKVGTTAIVTHAGVDPDFDQLADPCVLEVNGASYLYTSGVHNANSTGAVILWTIGAPLAMVLDGQAPITAASGTLELTDGSHDLTGVTKITVTGGTVGGTSANATLTIAGGSGAGGLAPMVNGDLPGPSPIATTDGQFWMAPTS